MRRSPSQTAKRVVWLALLAMWLGAATGCASLDVDDPLAWFAGKDDKSVVPTRLLAFWKDTILHHTNSPSVRGFGGRLMFYDGKSEAPVRVDGKLVVYVFDEEGRAPSDTKPDRKYVLTREQFAEHYSESEIGHSYSVWIPWDAVGGPQKKLSLIVRFKPTEGEMVVSEQASAVLPGTVLPSTVPPGTIGQAETAGRSSTTPRAPRGVQPVAYNQTIPEAEPTEAGASPLPRMDTHTISLPPRFGRLAPTAEVRRPAKVRRERALLRPIPTHAAPVPAALQTTGAATAPTFPAKAPPRAGWTPPRSSTRFSPAAPRAPIGPVARPAFGRTTTPRPPAG